MPSYVITTLDEAPVSLTLKGATGGYVEIEARRTGVDAEVIARFDPDGKLELVTGIGTELTALGLHQTSGKLTVEDMP
jgi:hypothetical protein